MKVAVALGIAALGLVTAGPLTADPDASDVPAKLKAAQASVQSFRMQIAGPGMTGIVTFERTPTRVKLELASGPVTMEMYASDGYIYQNVMGTGWKRQPLPTGTALVDAQRLFEGTAQFVPVADVVDGGVTYGAVAITLPVASIPGAPAATPVTLTCAYDKTTLLMHRCSSALVTETFVGYNDPANAIVLPPALGHAVDVPSWLVPAAAAPAPSPSP